MNEFKYVIKSKIRFVSRMPKYFRYMKEHRFGLCSVCGRKSIFLAHQENTRESLHCVYCNAWLRVRFHVEQIIKTFSSEGSNSLAELVKEEHFLRLHIYSAQAQGSIHNVLKKCPNYTCSEYFDNIEPGKFYKGTRCEDLQGLSFNDKEFDLVLHAAVLEHVRKPLLALKETYRVLKDGGHSIFTIPMTDLCAKKLREKSINRVDTSTEEDIFILEPIYHGDPLRKEGALVYTDFGLDTIDRLKEIGFGVEVKTMSLDNPLKNHIVVFICKK